MDRGNSSGRAGRPIAPTLARRRRPPARSAAIPRRETSGTFTPAVIEDIQIKAELARYRIRGFGSLRPRTWATFDDLTFIPGTLTRIPLEGYREACATRTVLGTRFATQADRARDPADGHRA